ncbi:class I SAM-dependent methyltransferase [Achromobacter marplatensis]|jgi:SAM-dependent methyltransferase|uniref:class I SAM-dependent methyltransferase n=1 Tax=Achromobacter marplatensis TaxID=470868 RepID=UPI003C7829AE
MFPDPWLDRWLPLILERAGNAPVLEVGCGHGDDTVTLARAGLAVTAFDLSPANVAIAAARAPTARIEQRDVRAPLPETPTPFGAVIASLSLHYFPWSETTAIVDRILECLRPAGLLLCRLNATDDHQFGAGSGTQIDENFYVVNNQPKRFFDKQAIERLFAQGWLQLSLEPRTTRKYFKQKALWEVVLEKAG